MATNLPSQLKVYKNAGNTLVLDAVPRDAKTILDVGCGAGDNAQSLHARGMTIDGITLSESEAVLARAVCRQVVVHNLEEGLPPQLADRYDAFICSHVLEHIAHPSRLLQDILAKACANDGKVVVALPNLMMWRYRVPLLLGRFEYTETGVMDATHVRWYTFASAQQLFRREGFAVDDARVEGAFPLAFLRRVLPSRVRAAIDGLAGRWLPGMFGIQMVFTLSPARR